MTDDGFSTMSDFLTAAGLFERGTPELALSWLFPFELDDHRVHLLVAVGAVLTGTAAATRPPTDSGLGDGPEGLLRALATQLVDAGGRLDTGRIRDLIATHCTVTWVDYLLTDVAVELLRRFVVCTGVGR